MKMCLAIQSLRSCGLEESAGIARALGFTALDLDGVMDTTLNREKILKRDGGEIARVKALGLTIPNIHWTFSPGGLFPAINDPDPKVRADNLEQIKRLVDFCQAAHILSILVLPGMPISGQSLTESHQYSADAMRQFQTIGLEAGVGMMFEPHVKSTFESPAAAVWLVQQAPGAGVVLDYSHFVCQGYTQPEINKLIPYTQHVHLRQARPGLLQTRLDDGVINFPLVFEALRAENYSGYLCIEYVYQDYIGANNVDVLTETVKTRDLIRQHIALE